MDAESTGEGTVNAEVADDDDAKTGNVGRIKFVAMAPVTPCNALRLLSATVLMLVPGDVGIADAEESCFGIEVLSDSSRRA